MHQKTLPGSPNLAGIFSESYYLLTLIKQDNV